MSEMVERVAVAICPWSGKKSDACPDCKVCLANAHAAIGAMRKPTRKMIDAAWISTTIIGDHPKGVLSHKAKTRTRWNAMIDEALK